MGRSKFFEEAHIVLREESKVFHPVFQVGYALYTHAESKAGIFFGVDAACFEHGRVYHAAAEDFHPAGTLAERASLAAAQVAAYIHLGRRLGEGEVARTKAYACVGAEHLAGEVQQRLPGGRQKSRCGLHTAPLPGGRSSAREPK